MERASRVSTLALATFAGVCAYSCEKTVVEKGLTGVELTVQYEGLAPSLLSFVAVGETEQELFEEFRRPEVGGTLPRGQTDIVILFADALAGTDVAFRVRGLVGEDTVGEGRVAVTLVARKLVAATVTLAAGWCGDGSVIAPEQCDDGDLDPDDGCDPSCEVEAGWSCVGTGPSSCDECGNSTVGGAETCDDGNTGSTDGCDSTCQVEAGWSCSGVGPGSCDECGNGSLGGLEECDDDDTATGDGCDDDCKVELGWTCTTTAPSDCSECGDGSVGGTEVCDDGNTAAGDGCDADCKPESPFSCDGASPTICARAPAADEIVINELLHDPAPDLTGDANGDGTTDSLDDEFVELINVSGVHLDIGSCVIWDAGTDRYTFPAVAILERRSGAVVFGAGTPTGSFGGADLYLTGGGQGMGLNNDPGDTVRLVCGAVDPVDQVTYTSDGTENQSFVRETDGDPSAQLILHSSHADAGGALFSPGTCADGRAFSDCLPP